MDAMDALLKKPEEKEEDNSSNTSKLGMALIAALPTLIGAAIAGNQGGAIGAEAGQKGLGILSEAEKSRAAAEAKKKEKEEDRAARLELVQAQEKMRQADKMDERAFQTQLADRRLGAEVQKEERSLGRQEQKEKRELERETTIPGLSIAEGAKPTRDDAKEMKNSVERAAQIRSSLSQLQSLVDKKGSEIYGPSADQMSQLVTDARLNAKELYKLGVLTGPDMTLLSAVIPDPTSIGSALTRKSTLVENLNKAQAIIADKVAQTAKARGYVLPESAKQSESVAAVEKPISIGGKAPLTPSQARALLEQRQQQKAR